MADQIFSEKQSSVNTLSTAWNLYAKLVLSSASDKAQGTEEGRCLESRDLSPQTVYHCLSLLRRVLRRAIEWELYPGPIPVFRMPKFDNKQKNIAPDVITMIEGIEKVARQGKAKPMAFVPLMENTRERALAERLAAVGVPILPPTHYAFSTLRHLADFIQYNADEKDLDLPVATKGQTVGAGTPVALTERVSKEKLGKYGMPVTREVLVPCEAGGAKAAAAAESLGFPVVMKIESEQIMHKSDVGGVVLNVRDSGEAAAAFDRILENVRINAPEACLNGVLIQEMAPAGLEIIIGVNNDPQFGPVVLCGLGGIFVEIFKDIALCPAPVSRSEAMNMLKSLKGYPLLKGARGGKKLDMEAVVTAIMSVSKYATEHMDKVSQIDINPLLVYPEGQGAKAVDALIINKT